jgi:hypothetical protein
MATELNSNEKLTLRGDIETKEITLEVQQNA